MADQKKQVDPKPYEKHECQGKYMEPGRPWTGADDSGESLCMHCDVNHSCWAIKNGKAESFRNTIPLESLHPLKRSSVEGALRKYDGLRVDRIDTPGKPSTFVMVLRDGTELPCDFPEPEGGGVGEFVMLPTAPGD